LGIIREKGEEKRPRDLEGLTVEASVQVEGRATSVD